MMSESAADPKVHFTSIQIYAMPSSFYCIQVVKHNYVLCSVYIYNYSSTTLKFAKILVVW